MRSNNCKDTWRERFNHMDIRMTLMNQMVLAPGCVYQFIMHTLSKHTVWFESEGKKEPSHKGKYWCFSNRAPRRAFPQGLELLQETKGKDGINKALDMKESRSRRAAVACIILFCTAPSGREIILFVNLFFETRACSSDPRFC